MRALLVECNQSLESAQVVGVAERVRNAVEAAVGCEAVMDDHAAGKLFRHIAPFGRNAVKREGVGCDCMQPLRPASQAKGGFVETAHTRARKPRANPGRD